MPQKLNYEYRKMIRIFGGNGLNSKLNSKSRSYPRDLATLRETRRLVPYLGAR